MHSQPPPGMPPAPALTAVFTICLVLPMVSLPYVWINVVGIGGPLVAFTAFLLLCALLSLPVSAMRLEQLALDPRNGPAAAHVGQWGPKPMRVTMSVMCCTSTVFHVGAVVALMVDAASRTGLSTLGALLLVAIGVVVGAGVAGMPVRQGVCVVLMFWFLALVPVVVSMLLTLQYVDTARTFAIVASANLGDLLIYATWLMIPMCWGVFNIAHATNQRAVFSAVTFTHVISLIVIVLVLLSCIGATALPINLIDMQRFHVGIGFPEGLLASVQFISSWSAYVATLTTAATAFSQTNFTFGLYSEISEWLEYTDRVTDAPVHAVLLLAIPSMIVGAFFPLRVAIYLDTWFFVFDLMATIMTYMTLRGTVNSSSRDVTGGTPLPAYLPLSNSRKWVGPPLTLVFLLTGTLLITAPLAATVTVVLYWGLVALIISATAAVNHYLHTPPPASAHTDQTGTTTTTATERTVSARSSLSRRT